MVAKPFAQSGVNKIAVVLDPRFPGGTASAVAQELPILRRFANVEVYGVSSAMFKDKPVNPVLQSALERNRLDLIWDAPIVSVDLIILHNPSFLKFDTELTSRLVCQNLIVISHENFDTPLGTPGFDVDGCMERIADASLCAGRYLAPVSDYNRETLTNWVASQDNWHVTSHNWFNICDFDILPPTSKPSDRRGRYSRPGFEKFPNQETLELLFPASAEHNAILGADAFSENATPAHWMLYPFRSIPVHQLLSEIDFFVYFTHPTWRESFGRVLAEATAAGKLVITDPETAQNFGDGIIGAAPEDVSNLIANFVAKPNDYVKTVLEAQATLTKFSPDAFADRFEEIISPMTHSRLKAAQ